METCLGPVGRDVEPVLQHSQRHYAGFALDLVNAVPSLLWKMLLKTLVLSLLPRRLELRDSFLLRVQATDIF